MNDAETVLPGGFTDFCLICADAEGAGLSSDGSGVVDARAMRGFPLPSGKLCMSGEVESSINCGSGAGGSNRNSPNIIANKGAYLGETKRIKRKHVCNK